MKLNIVEHLSAPTVKSKIELIDHLIGRLQEHRSNSIYKDKIESFIDSGEKKSIATNSFQIIGPEASLSRLVADYLFNLVTIKDPSMQEEFLHQLLEEMDALEDSSRQLIKDSAVEDCIQILKLWKIDSIFKDEYGRKLMIYLLPHGNHKVNGYYYVGLNGIGLFKSKIGFGEFVFFHEVGHLLADRITGNPMEVPASFIEFNKENPLPTQQDYAELFADLFTIAVMQNTSVADCNPLIQLLPKGEPQKIKNYFSPLITAEVVESSNGN